MEWDRLCYFFTKKKGRRRLLFRQSFPKTRPRHLLNFDRSLNYDGLVKVSDIFQRIFENNRLTGNGGVLNMLGGGQ